MPHLFSALSSRLVTKNGIVLMGIAAVVALTITGGEVGLLVVLYSINVFLTFILSLAGLCRYRWRERGRDHNLRQLIVPFLALVVCAAILLTTLLEKFLTGAWITVVITGLVILCGTLIKRHYALVQQRVEKAEEELMYTFACENGKAIAPAIHREKPTAVFLVSETSASGMHEFLWVQREFPEIFKNFIFVSVGEIDTEEFSDQKKWNKLRRDTKQLLKKYVDYCRCKGLPSTFFHDYGTDIVDKLTTLTERIAGEFPKATFFATKLISDNENFLTQLLHNQTAYILQRRLHNRGKTMIIMPMKL